MFMANMGLNIFFTQLNPIGHIHYLVSPQYYVHGPGQLKAGRNEPSPVFEGRQEDQTKALPFLSHPNWTLKAILSFDYLIFKGRGTK